MNVFLLPQPTGYERALARRLSASARSRADWKRFPSGEAHVRVLGVRRSAVVIGRNAPGTDDAVLTALLCDTLRRNGARKIQLVLPYFTYARQDRALEEGEAVSAACLATLFAAAGAARIVAVDLHSGRFASPIPVESASVLPSMGLKLRGLVRGAAVVAADGGARTRARLFREAYGGPEPCWIEKRRGAGGAPKALALRGTFRGGPAVIVDDMVDGGRTIAEAARLLRARGATRLFLCAAHPVLSGDGPARLRKLRFERILFSDALPPPAAKLPRVIIVSSVPALAAAVRAHARAFDV